MDASEARQLLHKRNQAVQEYHRRTKELYEELVERKFPSEEELKCASLSDLDFDDPESITGELLAEFWEGCLRIPALEDRWTQWISEQSPFFRGASYHESYGAPKGQRTYSLPIIYTDISNGREPLTVTEDDVNAVLRVRKLVTLSNPAVEDLDFQILEPSCGENGSFTLRVISGNKAEVRQEWSARHVGSIESCLAYIQASVGYGSKAHLSLNSSDEYDTW